VVNDLAAHESAALNPTQFEDMQGVHKRYRKRGGTQDACMLPCERGLPKSNATAQDLVAYQQRSDDLTGGFDPCSLIR